MLLFGLLIIAGFALAIVPGIIFMVWFSLAMYVFISEDIKGMNALLKSKEYVRGRWGSIFWRFFGFWLFVIGTSIILGFIPILNIFSGLISAFVFTPLGIIYGFLVYNNIKLLKGEFEFVPKKRGGFIAVVILGALIIPGMLFATISLVALNSARITTRDIRRQADIRMIQNALEIYYSDHNYTYPSLLNELQSPDYSLPVDPSTKQPYQYQLEQNGKNYKLCAQMEDTKEQKCVTPQF